MTKREHFKSTMMEDLKTFIAKRCGLLSHRQLSPHAGAHLRMAASLVNHECRDLRGGKKQKKKQKTDWTIEHRYCCCYCCCCYSTEKGMYQIVFAVVPVLFLFCCFFFLPDTGNKKGSKQVCASLCDCKQNYCERKLHSRLIIWTDYHHCFYYIYLNAI